MTQTPALKAAEELRLDAKAFRENTVYDSEGDPIRLIANAERMEVAASVIEKLCTPDPAVAGLVEALQKVRAFNRGEGEYNFSRLPIMERANQSDDAWNLIATEIDAALKTWSAQ